MAPFVLSQGVLLELPHPLHRRGRDVVPLLDLSVQQERHAAGDEDVEDPDLPASQLEKPISERSRVGASEGVSLLSQALQERGRIDPVLRPERPEEVGRRPFAVLGLVGIDLPVRSCGQCPCFLDIL